MAQQSITLTASMRANLTSLKSIQKQMDTTQERLSTGKKVNSAIDNASSYYQSRALTNRASDLDALLDSMGQGIQTIQAANEGIEAVTSFVEQLKSVANSAYALDPTTVTYEDSIATYKKQFDTIQEEIQKLVADSSYQGINLLKGGKLTVTFNETRSNKFDVQGENILTKMNIENAETAWVNPDSTDKYLTEAVTIKEAVVVAKDTALYEKGGNYYALIDGKYYEASESTGTGNGYDEVSTTAETDSTGFSAQNTVKMASDFEFAAAVTAAKDTTQVFKLDGEEIVKASDNKYYYLETKALVGTDGSEPADKTNAKTGGSYADSIDKTITTIAKATDYLRSYATELGNNYSIIETRQNFTEALIDVLETGSDNLVLADMNEESANYLALQTRQQLAINSLSLASQSAQSVLNLF